MKNKIIIMYWFLIPYTPNIIIQITIIDQLVTVLFIINKNVYIILEVINQKKKKSIDSFFLFFFFYILFFFYRLKTFVSLIC